MSGIVSYGAYVPIYRLTSEILGKVWGEIGEKSERSIANFDEDSITMAVEAGRDCLNGVDRTGIEALYFASTSPPYEEKQSASIIAAALDLPEHVATADFSHSLRSSTSALRAALDAVNAGSAKTVMVIAADMRLPPPGSNSESQFGDGAAAVLIGKSNLAIEVKQSRTIYSEFLDTWRLPQERLSRTWEDRFIKEEGYTKHLQKVVSTLLKSEGLSPKDFSTVVLYAPDNRSHAAMARSLGFDSTTQIREPLFNRIGHTGAALTLMMLIDALSEAKPGNRILLASYGDGADAYVLEVTNNIDKVKACRGLKKFLESKLPIDNYGKYIKFRQLMQFEETPDFRVRTSLPLIWRDRNQIYRLHGQKCRKCGQVQFPQQQVCMYCQTRGQFDEVPLADKQGTLFTYSMDLRTPVIDPPNVLGVVNLDGGGRFYGQITDRDIKALKVGMRMEMTFRKIHDALGIHNYFWKTRPVRG